MGLLEPHGRHRRRGSEADLIRVKLPTLDAAAKAQLWGLAFSFALALFVANRMQLGLGLFVIGCGAAWAAWEFLGARRIATSVPVALISGLAIPWGGFLLAFALATLRP